VSKDHQTLIFLDVPFPMAPKRNNRLKACLYVKDEGAKAVKYYQGMTPRESYNVLVGKTHPVEDIPQMWCTYNEY